MIALASSSEWNLRPSEQDILLATSRRELEDGKRYARQGRVSELRRSDDGARVTALTRGSRPHPYSQEIRLSQGKNGNVLVAGSCSCPVSYNCKHIAAVLVAARERWHAAPPSLQLPPPEIGQPPQVPPELHYWLNDLRDCAIADSDEYPDGVRHRLFYVFKVEPRPGRTAVLHVEPWTSQELKNGGLGQGFPFKLHTWPGQIPRYVRPADRPVLDRLSRQTWDESLVPAIVATARGRIGGIEGPTVREGETRQARVAWVLNEADGTQTPALEMDGSGTPLLTPSRTGMPPSFWYLDVKAAVIGPLLLGIPAATAAGLLSAPPVPPLAVPAIRERLSSVALVAASLPRELAPPEQITEPPVPVLRLTTAETVVFGRYSYETERVRIPAARLAFRYGPLLVSGRERSSVRSHRGRLYSFTHDQRIEAGGRGLLAKLGFAELPQQGWVRPDPDEPAAFVLQSAEDWLNFLAQAAPRLREHGWDIEPEPDFPFRLVEPDDAVSAELTEGSGIDWFDLHLGVTVGGERIDLVPALLSMIASMTSADRNTLSAGPADAERPFFAPLLDGRMLMLNLAQVRPVLLALYELFNRGTLDGKATFITVSRHDAAEIAALEEAASALRWKGGEALRALGRQLREAGDTIPPALLPTSFNANLRPYQARGVDWLQMLRGAELGGVLADDMGLGKTVQTLAHLAIEKEAGRLDCPALIVCPTSLVPNWAAEAARFAPALRVLVLHGLGRKQHFGAIPEHDLVITSYALLPRDADVLRAQQWHVLVLDEAQNVKNPLAETRRLAAQLQARQCICLSGTPLENHLGELWSLFDIVAPGFLGSRDQFRGAWRTPIEKKNDEGRRLALANRIRPFLLRRTKEQVASDLPAKTEMVERIDLDAGQRTIYDSVRLAMHKRVRDAIAAKGLARSGIVILDALLKMRQACCDPRLLKLETVRKTKAGSAKLERLMELVPVLLDEGRNVLLFSQFTSMLALIESQLGKLGIGYELLTGDTKDRRTPVARFQCGKSRLFLLSLKAGGTGLNLTAADTVIHYDPWWNPAVEAQATDRAHRIGQDKPVFVYRLVTTGTIEEKMEELKARKQALVDGILSGAGTGALSLTEADVEDLFG